MVVGESPAKPTLERGTQNLRVFKISLTKSYNMNQEL